MVEVIATDEFVEWWDGLRSEEQMPVGVLVKLLIAEGVGLGWPQSSSIKGSKYALRELRAQGRPLRVIYAFDPLRQAVLLMGGDKTGDDRFYERIIPQAENIWAQYLEEQKQRVK